MPINSALRKLALGLGLLVAICSSALAEVGVVISTNGSSATILIVNAPIPGIGSKVNVAQNSLLGDAIGNASGKVGSVKGDLVTLSTDSPLQEGPATLTIAYDPAQDDAQSDAETGSGSAVGMRLGDLEPNFAFPGKGGADTNAQAEGDDEVAIFALVREWISVAEPPQNGEPGYNLRYTNWAQLVGTTPTGVITINAKPDDVGAMPFDAYLWARHPNLPSLNHCTLSQYVSAKIKGGSIAYCGGNAATAAFPTGSEVTENEEGATAQPMVGTGTITGRLFPKSDQDEYIFSAPHHGEWEFSIANSPADVDLRLGVYPAPDGGWLPDMSPSGDGKLVVDLPAPAAYILRVNAPNGSMESQSVYMINAIFHPSPDMFEPNHTIEQAQSIQGSRQITGTILPRGDRDEFIFEADHHGEWTINIDEQPEGLNLSLGVYPHPDGGWLPDMSPSGDGKIVVDLPAPGKYVLRASSRNGNNRSVTPYRLGLSYIESPDLFEPNHTIEQAQSIEGTRQITGTILPRGERDEFIFEADHHGEWTINIDEQPEGLNLSLGVYPHPDGGWLPDMSPSGDGKIVVDLPAPGKYVMRASSRNGNNRSVAPYRLGLSYIKSPDLFEPNRTIEQAQSIEGSRQITGTILPRGDKDEFIFEADHHGEWTIKIADQPEGLNLSLGVYPHPDGGWLTDMSPSGDGQIVVDLPSPGKYVLRANAASGNHRSVAPYRLDIKYARSPDVSEPNNSVDTARSIAGSGQILGTILPRGDKDEFIFGASGKQLVTVNIVQTPGFDLAIGIYKAPDGSWLGDKNPDPNQLTVEIPEAGDYVLRVTGRSGNDRSVSPYRLSLYR